MKKLFLVFALLLIKSAAIAQFADEHKGGLNIKFDEEESKYIRFIPFGQLWFQDFEGNHPSDGFSVRTMRVILYSQINDRFLILTHFGITSQNSQNMTPLGVDGDYKMAMQDAWGEYKVTPELYIGAGLHFWGGISRLTSGSALNMLSIDNNRSSSATLGLSDQFGRHMGVYFKGKLGKFDYRASINDNIVRTFDGDQHTELLPGEEKYLGRALADKGKYSFSAYVDYQFLDQESNLLPYRVGTYLGSRKVFNIGAGMFYHPDAIVKMDELGSIHNKNATHIGLDVFYDAPIGDNGAAITAYAKFMNSSMGDNYIFDRVVGDGKQYFAHVGYLIPKSAEEHKFRNRFQPYLTYSHRDFNALNKVAKDLKIGTNWYIDGQNAKLSAEYQKAIDMPKGKQHIFTLQAMIYL